jgi:hypothetical protein
MESIAELEAGRGLERELIEPDDQAASETPRSKERA